MALELDLRYTISTLFRFVSDFSREKKRIRWVYTCTNVSLKGIYRCICPCSSTDRVAVFGTVDGGSIPSKGTKRYSRARSSMVEHLDLVGTVLGYDSLSIGKYQTKNITLVL